MNNHVINRLAFAMAILLVALVGMPTGLLAQTLTRGRLIAISGRARAGNQENTLILGAVVSGPAIPVLAQCVGPTLMKFGVSDVLLDPSMRIYQASTDSSGNPVQVSVGGNDDWETDLATGLSQANTASAAAAATGAVALPSGSLDSAIVTNLSGMDSFMVLTKNGAGGNVLASLYQMPSASTGRFVDVSMRTWVGTGDDVLIVGFVISGGPLPVLIRGSGPNLLKYGIVGVLQAPRIELYKQPTATTNYPVLLQSDQGWGGDPIIAQVTRAVGAPQFDAGANDCAMLVTLQPGAYTVVMKGVNATTGVGLLEVFEAP